MGLFVSYHRNIKIRSTLLTKAKIYDYRENEIGALVRLVTEGFEFVESKLGREIMVFLHEYGALVQE